MAQPARLRHHRAIRDRHGVAFPAASKETPAFTPVSALDYIGGNLLACGVMVALRRRALTGGSWMVRTSLVSAQHWLDRLGLLPPAAVTALPADVPNDVIAPYMRTVEASVGAVRYLGPVLAMSGTPPGTDRPPVPLGTHKPEWLLR